MDAIHRLCGQQYLREKRELYLIIQQLMEEHPEWTAAQIYNQAGRVQSSRAQRNQLQVQPGVVVVNQSFSGRLTPNQDGTPGAISRSKATNAVAISEGGERLGFKRLETSD